MGGTRLESFTWYLGLPLSMLPPTPNHIIYSPLPGSPLIGVGRFGWFCPHQGLRELFFQGLLCFLREVQRQEVLLQRDEILMVKI